MTQSCEEHINGSRLLSVFPGSRSYFVYLPNKSGEVIGMYITLQELIALATFIFLVWNHFDQNKKR